jgi:hypothetical protein
MTAPAKRERVRRQDLTALRCSRSRFDEPLPEDQQNGNWSRQKLLEMNLRFTKSMLVALKKRR